MSSRALQRYQRYFEWWAKAEKRIIRLTILLCIAIYAVQLVNFVFEQRGKELLSASLSELEGVSVAESQTLINMGTLELSVTSKSDYSKIQIFINGEYYKSFSQKSVSLKVKNNDIIELSGIYNEYPATIKVTALSDNVAMPKIDSVIRVGRGFVQAGRVRLK